jgi:hypothetical protein
MANPRTAILNGFGRSLGDSLIGLQALSIAQRSGILPRPLLVRRIYGRPLVDQLYDIAHDFADVTIIPDDQADDAPAGHDDVIDIRDFAFDPAFRGVAMIDFFLKRLGLDPRLVPSQAKRNRWLHTRIRTTRPEQLPSPYALVCPGSSMPLRDMPAAIHDSILEAIAKQTDLAPVTQGRSTRPGVIGVPDCDSIEALCSLVANATCLISTDTAMIHLADAFDVPCLAIFTTHRPEWRVRDYPGCHPMHLPVYCLPDALEFARDSSDIEAVIQAWHNRAALLLAKLNAFLNTTLLGPQKFMEI